MTKLNPLYKLWGYEDPNAYEKLTIIMFLIFIIVLIMFMQTGIEANKIRQNFNNYAYNVTFFCEKIYPYLKNGTKIDIQDFIRESVSLGNISPINASI